MWTRRRSAPQNAAAKEFDHLLVYNVLNHFPAAVRRGAAGVRHRKQGPAHCLNAAGDRLYVPNLFAGRRSRRPTRRSATSSSARRTRLPDKPGRITLAKGQGNQWALSDYVRDEPGPISKDVVLA